MAVLLIRDGVIIDKNVILMGVDEIADSETLSDLILRYYHNPEIIPREISLSFPLDEEMSEAVAEDPYAEQRSCR